MSLPVNIEGPGPGKRVKVTNAGQMVVSPVDYDDTKFQEVGTANVAVNFYAPRPGQSFVITVIRAKADRDVSPTADATVVVFEASNDSTATVDKVLHQEAMVRAETFTLTGLNIKVTEGKWVNAKTTDDDIHMTIMGYYVDN